MIVWLCVGALVLGTLWAVMIDRAQSTARRVLALAGNVALWVFLLFWFAAARREMTEAQAAPFVWLWALIAVEALFLAVICWVIPGTPAPPASNPPPTYPNSTTAAQRARHLRARYASKTRRP